MSDNIYDALRESHEVQRSLLRKLLRTKPGTQERISQFRQVRIELEAHEAAEERFLYAPMLARRHGPDLHAPCIARAHEIDELVEDVQKLDPAGAHGSRRPRSCRTRCTTTCARRRRSSSSLGKILSDPQKTRLAKQYRKDYLRMHKVLAAV